MSSGLPFSTDAWPLIRNTELLLENTPVSLSHEVFDGYNNYWPASSIFGAVFSLISGLSPMVAMSMSIPAVHSYYRVVFKELVHEYERAHIRSRSTNSITSNRHIDVVCLEILIRLSFNE
ncbi:MAG: hypothetical protein QW701_02030 [Candidatus Nezhaarchaeales archaeon]